MALEPSNVDVQANIGVLLFFADKSAEAIPRCGRRWRHSPIWPRCLSRWGHEDQAPPLLEQVVDPGPSIALTHLRLSQLYHRKGMFKEFVKQAKLYKKYIELKARLTASYKELRVRPQDIDASDSTVK